MKPIIVGWPHVTFLRMSLARRMATDVVNLDDDFNAHIGTAITQFVILFIAPQYIILCPSAHYRKLGLKMNHKLDT